MSLGFNGKCKFKWWELHRCAYNFFFFFCQSQQERTKPRKKRKEEKDHFDRLFPFRNLRWASFPNGLPRRRPQIAWLNLNIQFHKTDAQNTNTETSRTQGVRRKKEKKNSYTREKMSKDEMTSDFQPTSPNVDSIRAQLGHRSSTPMNACLLFNPSPQTTCTFTIITLSANCMRHWIQPRRDPCSGQH